jgi:hypothetical protein
VGYSALLNSWMVIHTAKITEKIAVPIDAKSAMNDIIYPPDKLYWMTSNNGNSELRETETIVD